jgi:hypothetical protein
MELASVRPFDRLFAIAALHHLFAVNKDDDIAFENAVVASDTNIGGLRSHHEPLPIFYTGPYQPVAGSQHTANHAVMAQAS